MACARTSITVPQQLLEDKREATSRDMRAAYSKHRQLWASECSVRWHWIKLLSAGFSHQILFTHDRSLQWSDWTSSLARKIYENFALLFWWQAFEEIGCLNKNVDLKRKTLFSLPNFSSGAIGSLDQFCCECERRNFGRCSSWQTRKKTRRTEEKRTKERQRWSQKNQAQAQEKERAADRQHVRPQPHLYSCSARCAWWLRPSRPGPAAHQGSVRGPTETMWRCREFGLSSADTALRPPSSARWSFPPRTATAPGPNANKCPWSTATSRLGDSWWCTSETKRWSAGKSCLKEDCRFGEFSSVSHIWSWKGVTFWNADHFQFLCFSIFLRSVKSRRRVLTFQVFTLWKRSCNHDLGKPRSEDTLCNIRLKICMSCFFIVHLHLLRLSCTAGDLSYVSSSKPDCILWT